MVDWQSLGPVLPRIWLYKHGGCDCALGSHSLIRREVCPRSLSGIRVRPEKGSRGMSYFVWITGIVLGLVWLSRVLDAARGVPKIADISEPDWDRRPTEPHRLAIIVPALNEEDSIEPALRRLLALDCDDYQVIAVNDRSTDQTGEIMDQVAAESAGRLKVVHVNELPSGWLGKVHAMWTAAQQAEDCDWLLFTDADVMFRPDCLRRAVAYAER